MYREILTKNLKVFMASVLGIAFLGGAYWLATDNDSEGFGFVNVKVNEPTRQTAGAAVVNPSSPDVIPIVRVPIMKMSYEGDSVVSSSALVGNLLSGAEIIRSEESVPDKDGRFSRLRIIKTSFIYPLIRIREHLRQNPDTGMVDFERSTIIVADHVIVRLQPGKTREDLNKLLTGTGSAVRREFTYSGIFLVSFDGTRPDAIESVFDKFRHRSDVIAKMTVDPINGIHGLGVGL